MMTAKARLLRKNRNMAAASLAPLYLGYVGTRARLSNQRITSQKQIMARTAFFARDTIDAIGIEVANWLVFSGNGMTEGGSGGVMTVTASVEYPANTFTRITWDVGSVGKAIADGLTAQSDIVTPAVAIPKGAKAWINIYATNPTAVLYDSRASLAFGDKTQLAASGIVDSTMAPFTDTVAASGFGFAPTTILGYTRQPSVVMYGSSRTHGGGTAGLDTNDASGDLGEVARSIGPYWGYCNLGVPSDSLLTFNAAHTKRQALGSRATHVMLEGGINDVTANIITLLTTAYTYFPSQKLYGITIAPKTSGAWTLADGSDQTTPINFAPANAFIMGNPAPLFGSCDIVPSISLAGNRLKWNADGTPGKYTVDGIHEVQFACLAIQNSGAINAAAFTV